MENFEKKDICTKEEKMKNNLKFSIAFNKDGESFQDVMERILINHLLEQK